MEAGLGTVSRIAPGRIDVARRAAQIAASRGRVLVVANRIREQADLDAIRAVMGDHELIAVPEEPAILRADRDGLAPIDVDPDAPGVRALVALTDRIVAYPVRS